MSAMEMISSKAGNLSLSLPAELPPDERILVACSGGSDSVALALALHEAGRRIVLAHVQHHLRGRAAEADARFVSRLASRLAVPFARADADVPALIRATGQSPEMAAREARHAALVSLARRRRLRAVAFAHHRRDQAETVLLAIARGAGPRAIGAMSFARRDEGSGLLFLRPLLDTAKEDILAFLALRRQPYRTDKTNFDGTSLRSRVRMRVLPLLAETLNPRIEEALCRVAEIARADDEALAHFARNSSEDLPALARRRALAALPPRATFRAVEAVLPNLGKMEPDLPNIGNSTRRARKTFCHEMSGSPSPFDEGRSRISSLDPRMRGKERAEASADAECQCSAKTDGICQTLAKSPGGARIWILPRLPSIKDFRPAAGFERTAEALYVSADAVKGKRLSFRRPRPGDRLEIGGPAGNKKISDILVNEKVPRALRAKTVLLVADGAVAALAGFRVAPAFRVPSPGAPSLVLRRPT
jgi:tRNA(Ile)-lysidine synthase